MKFFPPLSILVLIGVLLPPASHLRGLSEAEGNAPGLEPHKRTDASELSRLLARHGALQHQLTQQAPADHYIVVDTAHNRLYVIRRQEVLLTALASTGSGTILNNPDRPDTKWIFDTPRGGFTIQSKLMNPIWLKPDWAFLEEGLDVPTDPEQRFESGVLGDYALGFGKGYFIHGTLYARLLGKNVTHGCIRLNDEDLRRVYQLSKIGTPVMVF